MKVLFDTCVVLDIFGKGRFFTDSFTAYDVALFKKMDVCLSASSTTDIVYVLHKRGGLSRAEAQATAGRLCELFDIIDNTASDCRLAASSSMDDYEDALIAQSALRCGIDFIVTRNKKDFACSPVPALTPTEFVSIYRPSCLEYEEVEW